jgi:hypothetical protein
VTKPVSSVPNSFATATSTIPLSQLDTDFNTITQYLNDLNNYSNYVADTGTANAVILNYPSGITTTTIAIGTQLQFKAANANTSSTTLQVQVNSSTILTATTVLNEDGSNLSGNTLLSGGIYTVIYNGTNWILSGGGGSGGGASAGGFLYENTQTLSQNYTITTGKNAMCAGNVTVASGVTLTVPSGSRWVIV